MISQKMADALNEQANKEFFSSYLYLSMSAFFDSKNLGGMAQWMKMQSEEEYEHAMKFYEFILRVGGEVKLGAIEAPKTNWDNPLQIFEESLEHEKFISKSIHEIMDLAIEENNHPTKSFLQWFIDEQVEEEDSVGQIVENFRMIGDSKGGLFMLDRELGARSATEE